MGGEIDDFVIVEVDTYADFVGLALLAVEDQHVGLF